MSRIDGEARGEVDDVEGIVGRVVVAGPSCDLFEVDRGRIRALVRERDGDGRERAPALERVEALARDALEARRRDQADVDPPARAARRIGERRDVVRLRDLRERPARRVEDDLRAAARRGVRASAVGRRVDAAAGGDGSGEGADDGERDRRRRTAGKGRSCMSRGSTTTRRTSLSCALRSPASTCSRRAASAGRRSRRHFKKSQLPSTRQPCVFGWLR